jgi:hypothetical protein
MTMDENLRGQVEIYLSTLEVLIRRGREVRDELANPPPNGSAMVITRVWQDDCGVMINQLSGGSKAHWLARAFSEALLVRSSAGRAVDGADPAEIVQRLLRVLEQAVTSLAAMDGDNGAGAAGHTSASSEAPPPHRFDFVHNPELRPVVEQAYIDSRHALEQRDYDAALHISCGILEAIVTDALEYKGLSALAASGAPAGNIVDWSFNTRLAVAERAGLIRGGCARLPEVARTYRDPADAGRRSGAQTTVSERDARVAGQVLHVVMRDLDPGR